MENLMIIIFQVKSFLLFCAVKHREGSDIPNVDACIFMDKVEKKQVNVYLSNLWDVFYDMTKIKGKHTVLL